MSTTIGWVGVWILALIGSGCGTFLACALYLAGREERGQQ